MGNLYALLLKIKGCRTQKWSFGTDVRFHLRVMFKFHVNFSWCVSEKNVDNHGNHTCKWVKHECKPYKIKIKNRSGKFLERFQSEISRKNSIHQVATGKASSIHIRVVHRELQEIMTFQFEDELLHQLIGSVSLSRNIYIPGGPGFRL